jgi:predicted S18 family serine protease
MLSFLFAICEKPHSMLVPAVLGDSGGTVKLSACILPGTGDVYLTTFPYTGISTQMSVEDAVTYAFKKSYKPIGQYDVFVKISGSGLAGYVDGPSAGVALSVLAYAAINNISIRNDTMLTGSVTSSGEVGKVGGIYEKAKAAADAGMRYFITPANTFYEQLILKNLENNYKLQILEIDDAKQAIDFVFYNISINKSDVVAYKKSLPNISAYSANSVLLPFYNVTKKMIEKEQQQILSIRANDTLTAQVKSYFNSSAVRSEAIASKGYYFTAANEAFLDYVELLTIYDILNNQTDLTLRKQDVNLCLLSIKKMQKTDKNFEWILGAEARESWAIQKINNTKQGFGLVEEKYVAMNELNYAMAWCHVADTLNNQIDASGTVIQEENWRAYAAELLSEVEGLQKKSNENSEHLDSAKLSFSSGKYGAAVFDLLYAKNIDLAATSSIKSPYDSAEMGKLLQNLSREDRTSLWANVYQSQALYLMAINSSDHTTIYKLFLFARELDSSINTLKTIAVSLPADKEQSASYQQSQEDLFLLIIMLLILILLLFYTTRHKDYPFKSASRRSYGKGNKPKGSSAFPRVAKRSD